MDKIQAKQLKCFHRDDMLFVMEWESKNTKIVDDWGQYWSSEITLGKNQMCEWGVDVIKHGRICGIINIFDTEEEKKEFDQKKLDNKLNYN